MNAYGSNNVFLEYSRKANVSALGNNTVVYISLQRQRYFKEGEDGRLEGKEKTNKLDSEMEEEILT